MGHRALTTVIDEDGRTVAVLYSHSGAAEHFMLPKLATYLGSGERPEPGGLVAHLITAGNGMRLCGTDTRLTNTDAEKAYVVTFTRSNETGWKTVVGVRSVALRVGDADRWTRATAVYLDGAYQIAESAAHELRLLARAMTARAAENGWSTEVANRLQGDPAEVLAEADRLDPDVHTPAPGAEEYARAALDAYNKARSSEGGPFESDVAYLFADLAHLADREHEAGTLEDAADDDSGMDVLYAALDTAQTHYFPEVATRQQARQEAATSL